MSGRGTFQLVSHISLWVWSTPFTLPTGILELRKESLLFRISWLEAKVGFELLIQFSY